MRTDHPHQIEIYHSKPVLKYSFRKPKKNSESLQSATLLPNDLVCALINTNICTGDDCWLTACHCHMKSNECVWHSSYFFFLFFKYKFAFLKEDVQGLTRKKNEFSCIFSKCFSFSFYELE